MKRFHVNVMVADLARSKAFYTALFGTEAAVQKEDYAKWMLDDPRINFSIATGAGSKGIDHVGIQTNTVEELGEIQGRLDAANEEVINQPDAQCCYAHSSKTWVRDPDNVAWETFVTHGEIPHYGSDLAPAADLPKDRRASRCCDDKSEQACCI